MNRYTIIAGVNGTGKSSLRGVLEGQGIYLGHIIDADLISKENNFDNLAAGKKAISQIKNCLDKNLSFTQETTLAGHSIEKTLKKVREQGYYVSMFYIGLNSCEESLQRIQNRVKKGGHNIPTEDVIRRYANRMDAVACVLPYCDEVNFYDNENGFVKVAEIRNNKFGYTNGYRPAWIVEVEHHIMKELR